MQKIFFVLPVFFPDFFSETNLWIIKDHPSKIVLVAGEGWQRIDFKNAGESQIERKVFSRKQGVE